MKFSESILNIVITLLLITGGVVMIIGMIFGDHMLILLGVIAIIFGIVFDIKIGQDKIIKMFKEQK